MPIVIMKGESTFLAGSFYSVHEPHSVFSGTMKQAKAFCNDLNKRATTNTYYAVSVKLGKPGSK